MSPIVYRPLLRATARYIIGAPASPEDNPAPVATPDKWERLLWLGNWHAFLPALHAHLAQLAPSPAPPEISAALALASQANQLALLARQREALLLFERLESARVPAVLGSGWALAQSHQILPGLRQVGPTLTLWVRTAHFAIAAKVAAAAGYEVGDEPLRLISHTHSRLALCALPETHPLWNNTTPLSLAGRPLAVPSAAAWLLLWFSGDNLPAPRRLRVATDLVALASRVPDWDSLLQTAARSSCRRALLFGVGASHALVGVEPPRPVAAAIARAALAPLIDSCVADVWERPTKRLRPIETAWLQARLADRLEPRLRAFGRVVRAAVWPRATSTPGRSIGRYAPTPRPVVERLVSFAPFGPDDLVFDLGCGDGRIVIAAAQAGARGVGIDLDPVRIAEAQAATAAAGVGSRVEWRCADVWSVDLSAATVVTIYLQGFAYPRLRKKLLRELRPGTRVLSHDFIFPDWPPERSALVLAHPARTSLLHLWRIPELSGR